MKHKQLTFLLAMLMSMATNVASASIVLSNIDGIYYWVDENRKTAAVSYKRYYDDYYKEHIEENYYKENITIPESITYRGTTYRVTSIDRRAFYNSPHLTSICIPRSVTSIGSEAFYGCSSLNKAEFANIEHYLKEISFVGGFGESANPLYYANHLYLNGSEVTNLVIPNSITNIGDYAFSGCSRLVFITIPNSVTSIGDYAFYGCSGLTSVTIPNSVTSIGGCAFFNTILKSVTIGSGVLKIGKDVFSYNRTDNKNNGQKPTKVIWLTNTPPEGYSYAAGTVNYVANEQYTSLNNTTVYPFLSSMFEVDGVKYVPVSPSEKTCDAIDCNYDGTTKTINIDKTVSYKGVAMYVNEIHPYALYRMQGLENITLSHQGNIGKYAFANCSVTDKVTVSNQGNIGELAFAGSEIKKRLIISNSLKDIGHDAFNGCKTLPYATIDNSGEIGYCAFLDCADLEVAGIGGKVTAIGSSAFNGCRKLQWVSIPDAVKKVGEKAFRYCSAMTSAKIGKRVEDIASQAFEGCTSLNEVQIGENVKTIGAYAFTDCKALPSLFIPKATTNIGNYAFKGCLALKNIIMEDRAANATSTPEKRTFDDWTSTNKGQNNSTSQYTWEFSVKSGDVVSFSYDVSSESNHDYLVITINGKEYVKVSGEKTASFSGNFSYTGSATIVAKYTKDGSGNSGGDMAKVYNINIVSETNGGELELGSNGPHPLFADCPLDSVYIGRNISYPTSSGSGYSPFYRNTSLRSIHITNVETEVSPNEFYGCTNLKNVRLGDGIETIGDWAFSGCSSIDYFLFGNKTKTIGKEAFSDCTAMTRLISRATTPPTCGDQALDDINKWNCALEVPIGSKTAYQAAPQWKEFFFMEEGTTGVKAMKDEELKVKDVFDLSGRRQTKMQQGVNFLRMSDGTIKKVIKK